MKEKIKEEVLKELGINTDEMFPDIFEAIDLAIQKTSEWKDKEFKERFGLAAEILKQAKEQERQKVAEEIFRDIDRIPVGDLDFLQDEMDKVRKEWVKK